MKKELTEKQQTVLDFIKKCLSEGFTPTRREIAENFGWKSLNSAEEHVKALKRKGAIEIPKNRQRIIIL